MPADARPVIFVSATSRDLRSCRHRIKEALLTLGCMPVEQQNFPPNASTVREMLRARLKTCHAVIHLAGLVYGAEPTERAPGDPRRSYTQLEVDIARELGLPVYVFVCGDDFPLDPHDAEPEELQELQRAHRRALVSGDRLYEVIPHPEALERRVLTLQDRVEVLRSEIERSARRVRVGLGLAAATVILVGWLVFRQGGQLEEATEATKRVESSTARIEATVGDIAAGFARIDRGGGLIANPTRPEEHYHNALVCEQRGDAAQARVEYLAFAMSGVDAIDAFERLARLLRAQDGRAGAREVLGDLARRLPAKSIKLAHAMQFEGAVRTKRMQDFMTQHPEYGPVYFMLAQEFSEDRTGGQSLADKQREAQFLTKFLEAESEGGLASSFVDQQVLGTWIDRARERATALEPQLQSARTQPKMRASRSLDAWTIAFDLPEPALRLYYRLGDKGEWAATGMSGEVDLQTGGEAPRTSMTLPASQPAVKILLKYTSAKGEEMGPFALDFEPRSAIEVEQKEILEQLWTSWIGFEDWGATGRVITFDFLFIYRCGVDIVEYSFDGDVLDRTLDLPPCDEARLFRSDDRQYMSEPPGLSSVRVRIRYKDGTQSPVRTFVVPRPSASERVQQQRSADAALKHRLEDPSSPWLTLFGDPNQISLGQIVESRCVIERVSVSFDGPGLDRALDLPSCDGAQIAWWSINLPAPKDAKFVMVQITYKDGTKSEVRRFDLQPYPLFPSMRDAERRDLFKAPRLRLQEPESEWLRLIAASEGVRLVLGAIASNSYGIERIDFSVNTVALDRMLEIPPSHPRYPTAPWSVILEAPQDARFVMVQITFKDGTKSAVRRFDLAR